MLLDKLELVVKKLCVSEVAVLQVLGEEKKSSGGKKKVEEERRRVLESGVQEKKVLEWEVQGRRKGLEVTLLRMKKEVIEEVVAMMELGDISNGQEMLKQGQSKYYTRLVYVNLRRSL